MTEEQGNPAHNGQFLTYQCRLYASSSNLASETVWQQEKRFSRGKKGRNFPCSIEQLRIISWKPNSHHTEQSSIIFWKPNFSPYQTLSHGIITTMFRRKCEMQYNAM